MLNLVTGRKVWDADTYPSSLSSSVALYWKGISMRAARANAVSLSDGLPLLDMVVVKSTNCSDPKIFFNEVFESEISSFFFNNPEA